MRAGMISHSSIFQAALNLGESRLGALFVVLRDPGALGPPAHRPRRPDLGRGRRRRSPGPGEPLAQARQASPSSRRPRNETGRSRAIGARGDRLPGRCRRDRPRRPLITFGAILRIAPETLEMGRAVQGARTLAGLAASLHGPVLKVSEDGYLTMFLKGRRVWEL